MSVAIVAIPLIVADVNELSMNTEQAQMAGRSMHKGSTHHTPHTTLCEGGMNVSKLDLSARVCTTSNDDYAQELVLYGPLSWSTENPIKEICEEAEEWVSRYKEQPCNGRREKVAQGREESTVQEELRAGNMNRVHI